jgi:hypothetical protein
MGFEILDPDSFLENGAFFEKKFREKIDSFDWQKYKGHRVLVRGCAKIIPSWAYMVLTVKLAKYANAIYYGSEHDRIPVYNRRLDG